jgi:hypothetical protein
VPMWWNYSVCRKDFSVILFVLVTYTCNQMFQLIVQTIQKVCIMFECEPSSNLLHFCYVITCESMCFSKGPCSSIPNLLTFRL